MLVQYTSNTLSVMSPVEVVMDFFLSWDSARPTAPMHAGEQQDVVEAFRHICEECGLVGEVLTTGHAQFPDGLVECALPEEFKARDSCSLLELLQNTLHGDSALLHSPDVLALAFDNMYEEGARLGGLT
jgi:hypothetical protein